MKISSIVDRSVCVAHKIFLLFQVTRIVSSTLSHTHSVCVFFHLASLGTARVLCWRGVQFHIFFAISISHTHTRPPTKNQTVKQITSIRRARCSRSLDAFMRSCNIQMPTESTMHNNSAEPAFYGITLSTDALFCRDNSLLLRPSHSGCRRIGCESAAFYTAHRHTSGEHERGDGQAHGNKLLARLADVWLY